MTRSPRDDLSLGVVGLGAVAPDDDDGRLGLAEGGRGASEASSAQQPCPRLSHSAHRDEGRREEGDGGVPPEARRSGRSPPSSPLSPRPPFP